MKQKGSVLSAAIQRLKKAIPAGLLACLPPFTPVAAEDFTAGSVMERLTTDQSFYYMAGVVDGLAYARYMREGPEGDGMSCIYDWFYETDRGIEEVNAAFLRFPDHSPGAVMAALIEKECGP